MDWTDALAALDGGVAAVFDTGSFRLLPMARHGAGVNAPRLPDPERVVFSFAGSIEFGPGVLAMGYAHPSSLSGPDGLVERPVHQAVVTALSVDWPYAVREGDQVEHSGKRYTISAIPTDGSKRVALFINEVRR